MGISFVGLERGMSMAEKKIEDFGEKIGGARKDLYALNRELRYGDILDWNDMESSVPRQLQSQFKQQRKRSSFGTPPS